MQNPSYDQSLGTQADNLTRVKPQEGKIEQPASQRSTMQSVSMGEVPNYGQEENILGSVASIHDQMQPGSLENLSGEEKPATQEPGLIAQGVEAVKEAFYINKEERQEIKQAIISEAKALGEDISAFAHKTVEFFQELGHKIFGGAPRVQAQLIKKPYLVRRSVGRRLGKKTEKVQKQAGLAAGFSKVYIKEQSKNLRRKANRYYREFFNDTNAAKQYAQAEGEQLKGKARQFQREFAKDGSMFGAQLRAGAQDLKRKGRRLYNDLNRSLQQKKQQQQPQDFSTVKGNKFLLEFSSNEWNGTQSKPRTQNYYGQRTYTAPLENKVNQWRMEVSAHDWNETAGSTAKGQAYFLLRKAQDYIYRASKQSNTYQRRFQRQSRKLKRQAMGQKRALEGQVNQWVNQASQRLGDSTNQGLKEKGQQLYQDLDEAKDAAKRKLIEKKADLQYQAELLTKDKFPTQEALEKKEAINNEIRNLHGKENLQKSK